MALASLALTPWARVRREDFGLLFYNSRDTRLTFVRSGDSLQPGAPGLAARAVEWRGEDDGEVALRRVAVMLETRGLVLPYGKPQSPEQPSPEPPPPLSPPPAPERPAESTSVLRAPVNVTWEVTNSCDLHCRHCLSAELRSRGESELTLAGCASLLDDLASLGVFQLNFGGGEPFLRPDFLDLLRLAGEAGFTSCVSTNGLALTPALLEKLMQIQPVYLQVSLDGATPHTNDAIRGPGTFARIIAGIQLLAEYGYPDFSINTVVTRSNFMEIPDLLELAQRYGAKSRLSRFRPSGNAQACWEEMRLGRDLMERLSELLSERPDVKTGDSFFSITAADRRHLGLNMCGAGKMTCSLAPDGSVYPCAFLSDTRFRAGHVQDPGGVAPIWRQAPPLAALRGRAVDSCESCSRFSLCHGGCPAVAYFMTSELGYPDPECLRPAR